MTLGANTCVAVGGRRDGHACARRHLDSLACARADLDSLTQPAGAPRDSLAVLGVDLIDHACALGGLTRGARQAS